MFSFRSRMPCLEGNVSLKGVQLFLDVLLGENGLKFCFFNC